jgi:hypothetical protein
MNLPEKRKRLAIASAVLLVLLALLVAVCYFCANRRVVAVQQLRAQLTGQAGRTLTPEQRRALWNQMRERMRQLTPSERRELDKERRQQMKTYFSMSKKEKLAYLDQQIKRMEAARRESAQANANQRMNNGNIGPRMRTLDPEERDKRRRERLDFSTAEERADRAQFRKDLDQRRAQLGLPPLRGGPGRASRVLVGRG